MDRLRHNVGAVQGRMVLTVKTVQWREMCFSADSSPIPVESIIHIQRHEGGNDGKTAERGGLILILAMLQVQYNVGEDETKLNITDVGIIL